jgi:hypothetical protein
MNLAYVVIAARAPYFLSGRIALDSLRRFGGFEGRVVALTDRPWEAPGVEVHVLDRRRLVPPALYKAAIRDVVTLHAYDVVVYLDSDILVRGPIAPFLQRARARDLVCADDMGNAAVEGYCGTILTPEERTRAAAMPGANAGFFCARGDRLSAIFDAWQAIVDLVQRERRVRPVLGQSEDEADRADQRDRPRRRLEPWHPGVE